MPNANLVEAVPADIADRFRPEEAPTHEVIRRVGDVRLWQSVTKEEVYADRTRLPITRYHVTISDQAEFLLMARIDQATMVFDMVCAKKEAANV